MNSYVTFNKVTNDRNCDSVSRTVFSTNICWAYTLKIQTCRTSAFIEKTICMEVIVGPSLKTSNLCLYVV